MASTMRETKRARARAARAAAAEQALLAHLNDPNYDLRPPTPPPPYSESGDDSLSRESSDVTCEATTASEPSSSTYELASLPEKPRPRDDDVESNYKTPPSDEHELHEDESPYAEVRASVPNVDCTWMPVNTFRMWFLGIFYTVLVSGLNQLFHMRYPSICITGLVAQLTALPLGKVLEWILPTTRFHTFGYSWTLNPGPFSIKEHVVITIMANVVFGGAYATDIVATQRFFYRQSMSFSYQMLLILSTQLIGFSMGGLLRQFVVWPASMIWPSTLVNATLFTTLHKNYGMKQTGRVSREKFFCIALAGSFFWYWIPGYLWTGLSMFNWVCWAAPNNVVANQLFGAVTGLGMSVLTFDWTMVSFIGSPLVTPWWSQANSCVSFFIFFWFFTPILYYTNTWFTKYLPMSAYRAFANDGLPYHASAILTNSQFDVEKYRAYSPLFLSTTMLVTYGLAFASVSAMIVHTLLWYRHDIARRFRNTLRDEPDIHSRLMQAYPEVPHWWYAIIGVIPIIMLSIAIEIFPTQLPIWGMLVAFLLVGVLTLPMAIVQAVTNRDVAPNAVVQLLAGYMFEGKPVANMIFKCISVISCYQAVAFSSDMKLGHYMKIPPRIMFAAQTVAVVISCFVVEGVQEAMFANIVDLCSHDQKDGFICPVTNTFATASLFWGGIGPRRLFSPGSMYSNLLWCFLIGSIAPIPFYLLSRRYPYSFWRCVNMPVFFAGVQAMPPATGINYASWAITGFTFNYHIRRRHLRWWTQYNYTLSAALDGGVALGMIVVFFTLQLPKGGIALNWWGNTVWQNTADAKGIPLRVLGEGETFGPKTWY